MNSHVESDNNELTVINSNFTVDEVENAIDYLKNNKAPGVDLIPAEIVKHCKTSLSDTIAIAFNYIIEKREFPASWTEGIRSAVFKSGKYDKV